MNRFTNFIKGILFRKETSTISYDALNEGAVYNHNDTNLRTQIEGADRAVVTDTQTQTLSGKSIDADTNTITNIENADIKVAAAIDAAKIHDGSVSNTEFGYLANVTSDIQTQLDSMATDTDLNNHLNDTVDAHDASAISNVPSGNLAATDVQGALNELQTDINTRLTASSSDVLTNKSIDADTNTITNIENADIKAGAAIDASKIADGSVSSTEFQYLANVTSDIQTQLNSSLLNPMTTLGDTLYGGASGAVTRLPGDTSNTRKFIRELSVAGVATAPAWDTLIANDIPSTLNGTTFSGVILAPNGSISAPSYSFTNDPDTGMYIAGLGVLRLNTDGAVRLSIDSNVIQTLVRNTTVDGSASLPAYSFDNDSDCGMYRVATNFLGLATNGAARLFIDDTRVFPTVQCVGIDGTAGAPTFSFNNDNDCGLFYHSANTMGLSIGGVTIAYISNNGLDVNTAGGRITATEFSNNGGAAHTFYNLNATADANTRALQIGLTGSDNMTNALFVRLIDSGGQIGSITAASGTSVAFNTTSDIRLKTNIEDFNALDLITQINPVKYERISDLGITEYGFLAQDLYSVLPQVVTPGGDCPHETPWQVDYGKMTGVLCKAIKEQQEMIEQLTARIDALENPPS